MYTRWRGCRRTPRASAGSGRSRSSSSDEEELWPGELDGERGPTRGKLLLAGTRAILLLAVLMPLLFGAIGRTLHAISSPQTPNAPQQPTETVVDTDITANQTWTQANSPYRVTANVQVLAGVTLTVEPGVEVRFEEAKGLTVEGTLTAVGTASRPITFTGTLEQPGWWTNIRIRGTSAVPNVGSELGWVTVEYAGRSYANLYLQDAQVNITNSTFRYSGKDGIYAWAGGVAHITDTQFISNTEYAVRFADGSMNPVLARLGGVGNGVDGVALGSGTLSGPHIWEEMGLPYVVVGNGSVEAGASLTVEPGVEVRFEEAKGLTVDGVLTAVGTVSRPITFTGTSEQPGWWTNIRIRGTSAVPNVGSELAHVTVEYAGRSYANLYLKDAQVRITDSRFRYSSKDGIYVWTGGGRSVVERSQIVDNAGYGINNRDTETPLRAENNWWGSDTGPRDDNGCNPTGTGSKVSENVFFKPFLSSPNEDPGPVAPGDARLLSIEPQGWFIPADGVTQAWVTITLRDGNGQPLAGRRVRLHSTLGEVTDGALTDVQGRSFAYVTSDVAGDAALTASLDAETCEMALSTSATVTFTAFEPGSELLPDAAAPYANGGLKYSPAPIVRGVTTTLSVDLTNPNDFPIRVNGSFGFAQLGIGLPFGPLGEVQDLEIPARGNRTVSVQWVPLISGKYCAVFDYNWTPVGATGAAQIGEKTFRAQSNLSVYPGTLGSKGEKESLEKADKAFGVVSKAPGAKQLFVQKHLIGRWWQWLKETAAEISRALGGDPPRQDYRTIAMPEWSVVPPVQPGADLSQARADAMNAVTDALLDVVAYGQAATISLDRYGGAAAASDLEWSAQQAAALIYYKQKMGQAMLATADALDVFIQVLRTEGDDQLVITLADAQAYQDRLRTQGFTAQEIQDAKLIGWTDEEIEAYRQEILAVDPATMVGDLVQMLVAEASVLRETGSVLAKGQNFPTPSNTAAGRSASPANNLARVYTARTSIQVGNPANITDTLTLRVRRVNLPGDWSVSVSPITATLAPGEVITATVTVAPGGPTVQGTVSRVAVEGYNGQGELISGVVVEVLVPRAAYFDGKLRLYLPSVQR